MEHRGSFSEGHRIDIEKRGVELKLRNRLLQGSLDDLEIEYKQKRSLLFKLNKENIEEVKAARKDILELENKIKEKKHRIKELFAEKDEIDQLNGDVEIAG